MTNSDPEPGANPDKPDKEKRRESSRDDPFAQIERALGAAFHLMAQDPGCAGKKLDELYRSVLPAIVTKQFRMVRNDQGEIVAYASWALVSPEAEKKATESEDPIALADWQSGKTALLVDLVCLDRKIAGEFVRRLKKEVFPDTIFKARKASRNGNETPQWAEVKLAQKEA